MQIPEFRQNDEFLFARPVPSGEGPEQSPSANLLAECLLKFHSRGPVNSLSTFFFQLRHASQIKSYYHPKAFINLSGFLCNTGEGMVTRPHTTLPTSLFSQSLTFPLLLCWPMCFRSAQTLWSFPSPERNCGACLPGPLLEKHIQS